MHVAAEDLSVIHEDKQSDRRPIKVFICHATSDAPLAEALVDLFQAALKLPAETIRCTSVSGYCLPGGSNVTEQLRREVHDADAFIGIISHQSMRSTFVLFELGARWGATRHLLPVLAPGLGSDVLAGPLSGIHALETTRDGLHQLVEDLGMELSCHLAAPTTYQRQIHRVLAIPTAAPTDISTTHRDHTPALTPEARALLIAAVNDKQNGAIFMTGSFAGLSISVGNSEFVETGDRRSEAKWKRAVEELQQAGFIEAPGGDGSLLEVTHAGFQMTDTLSGKEQPTAATLAAETERPAAELLPAVPDPSVQPPTPPDRPGPDWVRHYPAHWYAAPLPSTEELIDVRYVESAAELDELKASDPTRAWWDTPAKWPGLKLAEIRRVDGRPYGSG